MFGEKEMWHVIVPSVIALALLMFVLFCPVAWSGDSNLKFNMYDCIMNGVMKGGFMTKAIQIDQKEAEQCILDIHYACKHHGVDVMFSEGTALGIVRDGAVIPYDDDVDCIILKENRLRFLQNVLPELKSTGYKLSKTWRKGHFLTLVKSAVYVDIDFISINDFCQLGKHTPNPCPVDFIWNSRTLVNFKGHLLLCAGEAYLERAYGDWRTPIHRLNY